MRGPIAVGVVAALLGAAVTACAHLPPSAHASFRKARYFAEPRELTSSITVRNASPTIHATLALILLLGATLLGVYKPLGMTAYGRRKHDEQRHGFSSTTGASAARIGAIEAIRTPRWMCLSAVIALGILLLSVLLHLAGSGLGH